MRKNSKVVRYCTQYRFRRWTDHWYVLVRKTGTVLPQALLQASLATGLGVIYWLYVCDRGLQDKDGERSKMSTPVVYGFFMQAAGFILSLTANLSYNRYWEALTCMTEFTQSCLMVGSMILTFDIPQSNIGAAPTNSSSGSPRRRATPSDRTESPRAQNAGASTSGRALKFDDRYSKAEASEQSLPEFAPHSSSAQPSGDSNNPHLAPTPLFSFQAQGTAQLGRRIQSFPFESPPRFPADSLEVTTRTKAPLHPADGWQALSSQSVGLLPVPDVAKGAKHECCLWQADCIHLLTVLHAVCIQNLLCTDFYTEKTLDVLGGISAEEMQCLQRARDQPTLVFHWLQAKLSERVHAGGLKIPPPICAQLWVQLGSILNRYGNGKKISTNLIPLTFQQCLAWVDLCVGFFTPLWISGFVPNIYIAVVLNFITNMAFHGLYLAIFTMQQPFGNEPTDLPLVQQHANFIDSVLHIISHDVLLALEAHTLARTTKDPLGGQTPGQFDAQNLKSPAANSRRAYPQRDSWTHKHSVVIDGALGDVADLTPSDLSPGIVEIQRGFVEKGRFVGSGVVLPAALPREISRKATTKLPTGKNEP